MKTAVQWLVDQLTIIQQQALKDIIQQAKEMEKEQIMDSYLMGVYDMADKKVNPKEYYNKTYK